MKAALTGTPGTGKSTAASLIEGVRVVSVGEIAQREGSVAQADTDTDPIEIDTDVLSRYVADIDGDLLIEGHLSHLLGVDLAIVLRCSPKLLKERLLSRGYSDEKVRENIEAEAVDVILIEALESVDKVCEINATDLSPKAVADAVSEILAGESEKYPVGHVDWSQEVLDWF